MPTEVAPEDVVTEAPAPATTEAAVEETEAPSTHADVPVEETEAPLAQTEAPAEKTEAPLAQTEAPAEETVATTGATAATTENIETDVSEGNTAATEGAPETTEIAGNSEAPKTELLDNVDSGLETEAGQVIVTERDEVEMEDSDSDGKTTFGRCYYSVQLYKCAFWSHIHV